MTSCEIHKNFEESQIQMSKYLINKSLFCNSTSRAVGVYLIEVRIMSVKLDHMSNFSARSKTCTRFKNWASFFELLLLPKVNSFLCNLDSYRWQFDAITRLLCLLEWSDIPTSGSSSVTLRRDLFVQTIKNGAGHSAITHNTLLVSGRQQISTKK